MRSSPFSVLAAQGVTLPSSEAYVSPDFQTIAAFFLGWSFFYALECMIQSRFVSELVTKITRCKARSTSGSPVDKLDDLEKRGEQWEELVQTVDATAYLMRGDNPTILFAMYLCFAMASAANFGSLVTFNQSDGVAACAFVVAWSSMSTELAKIVALYVISLHLKQLSVRKREIYVLWASLVVVAALMLATTAIATGIPTALSSGIIICNKKRFLPTSIVASLLEFSVAFYAVIRLVGRLTSVHYNVPGRTGSLRDIRILQTLAFVFLVLITLVPNAVATTILGDSLPFAVGSVPVLATFSHCAQPLDDKEVVPSGETVARSFAAHRGRDEPTMLGVYIPSSASMRLSPMSAQPEMDLSDHPYATAEPALSRKSTIASRPTTRWIYPDSITWTDGVDENASVGHSRAGSELRIYRHAPNASASVNPVPAISSDNGPWPTGASRKIVQSQVAYASQLAREDAAQERMQALGPVPPLPRPMRPRVEIPDQRRTGGTLLAPDASKRTSTVTPNSAAVYGSDIVRLPLGRGVDRMRKHTSWSPADGAPPSTEPHTRRRSWLSPNTTSNYSDDSLRSRLGTPPRRRPTMVSQISDDSFFTPLPATMKTTGPRQRTRPPVFLPQSPGGPTTSGVSVTSLSGQAVDALSPGMAVPRVSWIRGPRPPPQSYQPAGPRHRNGRSSIILLSVREETSTPTRDLT